MIGRRSHLPHGLAKSSAANLCQRQASHHWCVALTSWPNIPSARRPTFLPHTQHIVPCSQLPSVFQVRKIASRFTARLKTYIRSPKNSARLQLPSHPPLPRYFTRRTHRDEIPSRSESCKSRMCCPYKSSEDTTIVLVYLVSTVA